MIHITNIGFLAPHDLIKMQPTQPIEIRHSEKMQYKIKQRAKLQNTGPATYLYLFESQRSLLCYASFLKRF